MKITNPKALRRSNKTRILFNLQNEGGKSRLQLARCLNLTPSSITQLVKELMEKNLVIESGSMQRNSTGRREVLLVINTYHFAAMGVNIEKDKVHISLCNYDKVICEEVFDTALLLSNKSVDKLGEKIRDIYKVYHKRYQILGLGLGIAGKVDEKNGISVASGGILPTSYPLQEELKKYVPLEIRVINNVKAQARSQISHREDNFMYIKHSPGMGGAIVVGGSIVDGYNAVAGEIGHTIVLENGLECECGRYGCLETLVSEKAIENTYLVKAGQKKSIDDIYKLYGKEQIASQILDNCMTILALAIGNAATINDPKKIMLTGGIFFQKELYQAFSKKMEEFGFSKYYEIINISDDKKIKAYAGARHILLEKLFEV